MSASLSSALKLPRLLEHYRKTLNGELCTRFAHRNPMAAARLEKIVLNIGCGKAVQEAKVLDAAQRTLEIITGQRPSVTRAKRAVSNFRIKEGDAVGCKVTLRRRRMYEFLDRLVSVALPRLRDFRGLSLNGFDQAGNYSFGLEEQSIFPEVAMDELHYTLGMDVVLVLRTASREEAQALLEGFGFPFVKPQGAGAPAVGATSSGDASPRGAGAR
ncbi:MAG TPA: 50S ribosomal protein L5 [bacterium]